MLVEFEGEEVVQVVDAVSITQCQRKEGRRRRRARTNEG